MGQRRLRALVDGYTFIGTTEAGEILEESQKANTTKTLKRYGVEKQVLRLSPGGRPLAAYPIDEVLRVKDLVTRRGAKENAE